EPAHRRHAARVSGRAEPFRRAVESFSNNVTLPQLGRVAVQSRFICCKKTPVLRTSIGPRQRAVLNAANHELDRGTANVRFGLRVQLVTATLLVVYRQGFRSPRSSAVVD